MHDKDPHRRRKVTTGDANEIAALTDHSAMRTPCSVQRQRKNDWYGSTHSAAMTAVGRRSPVMLRDPMNCHRTTSASAAKLGAERTAELEMRNGRLHLSGGCRAAAP